MPLLRAEAEKLSNNQLVSGIIDQIIDRDDLFSILPFVGTNSKAYVYNRENTLAAGDWLDPNDTVNESSSSFTTVTAYLKILAGDVDIDKFLETVMSDTNDQMGIQIAKKAKGLGKMVHQAIATGDSSVNAKTFDGIAAISDDLPNTQIVTAGANGGALTLSMLDELVDSVPNGPDVIVMRRGTIRAYRQLLRATYGTDAVMQMLENFGKPMLTHNGIPILMNEFLSGTETQGTAAGNTTSVYALRMNEVDGLHMIYAAGAPAGMVVENIGTVQNKDATRIRLKWYLSMCLKSTRSIGRLKGVTNV